MKKCDQLLYEQSNAVDEALNLLKDNDRAFVSQFSLLPLRHFVEHVMLKIYCEDFGVDMNDDWQNIKAAQEYIYTHGQYYFISEFHQNHLQKSVSHKVESKKYSETLMILYYKPLLMIKNYLLQTCRMDVLKNLSKYPLDLDNTFLDYYRAIQKAVFKSHITEKAEGGHYYIYKKRPIWVDKKLMYELTLGLANDYADKQDRFIVFSTFDVFDNYAVEAYIVEEKIQYFDTFVSIKILEDYNVSIRTYELNNLGTILQSPNKVKRKQKEFSLMMDYIKEHKISLDKIIQFSDEAFEALSNFIKVQTNETPILDLLEKARDIVINNRTGSNVLKYLFCHAKNSIIRYQISDLPNPNISYLKLKNGVLLFEETPFAANLMRSKESTNSVFECIDDDNSDCQLLAKRISEQSDNTGQLYVKSSTIYNGGDINELISRFNNSLPDFQPERKIDCFGDNLFIKENEINTVRILKSLQSKTAHGIPGYSYQANQWIQLNEGNIKGEEKKSILTNMFDKSRVFVLYGSAGTGKSTTVSFALNILGNVSKLCLAPTHPAVDNMKRKINDPNAEYYTIKKFLFDKSIPGDWDVVVIDECSVVSNEAMIKVLEKLSFDALLLTGDIYQLPSINFGNWFHIVKSLLPAYACSELTKQFRTTDDNLLTLWDKVRTFDSSVYEFMCHNGMTNILDNTIFDGYDEDQIVLCYNYDGLYGINSINRYLQEKNPNKPQYWNQCVFKIGDPVIFHNTQRFNDILHNNLKGKIVGISKETDRITFEIAIESSLSSISFKYSNLEYVKNLKNGWTVIRFTVYKYNDDEEDAEPQEMHTVPFQVAYAVSIHKSQGLEYDSVKVIIANNVDELITHNVFYTAITRAKKRLMVYWTPETASKVLSSFEPHFDMKDSNIIKNRYFKNNH